MYSIDAAFDLQIIKIGENTSFGMAYNARHYRSIYRSGALEKRCAYRSFDLEHPLANRKFVV